MHQYSSVVQWVFENEAVLRTAIWSLRHGSPASNTSSRWFSDFASVLCRSSSASFVVDSSLCDGLKLLERSRSATAHAGSRPVADKLGVREGQHSGVTEASTAWVIPMPDKPLSTPACPSLDNLADDTTRLRQPL